MTDPSVDQRRVFFDQLYVSGEQIPWDRAGAPQPLLASWAAEHAILGAGRTAVVVGCGLGGDAEFLARLGFVTTGFDFSGPAVEAARRLNPGSPVDYAVADLLDLPADWLGRYDLVLESLTVQSLPRSLRPRMVAAVRSLVAPGGSVLVIAAQRGVREERPTGPWPLSRAEVESFARDGFTTTRLEEPPGPDGLPRWRAEFHRS
ncbi:MAG TPA: class I SAM-dependent methyltransferase [Mycobacteriales bacterium]|nr:class I SAM-dependent methyltransferase [Mycobacteriales bacterium]